MREEFLPRRSPSSILLLLYPRLSFRPLSGWQKTRQSVPAHDEFRFRRTVTYLRSLEVSKSFPVSKEPHLFPKKAHKLCARLSFHHVFRCSGTVTILLGHPGFCCYLLYTCFGRKLSMSFLIPVIFTNKKSLKNFYCELSFKRSELCKPRLWVNRQIDESRQWNENENR
jgi:hypothetical protein